MALGQDQRALAPRRLASDLLQYWLHHFCHNNEPCSKIYCHIYDDVSVRIVRMYLVVGFDFTAASSNEKSCSLCSRQCRVQPRVDLCIVLLSKFAGPSVLAGERRKRGFRRNVHPIGNGHKVLFGLEE